MSSPWGLVLLFSLFLQLSAVCMAQDVQADARKADPSSTTSSPSSSTSSAPAQTHTIQVGLADHKFRPEVTTAAIGDVSSIFNVLIQDKRDLHDQNGS